MRALLMALLLLASPAAAAPRVVADIAPVQSLLAMVMGGAGEPALLVRPGLSEHDHALRPSDARLLAEADLIVLVGPALTPWLAGPLASLAPAARVIELGALPGLPPAATDDPHLWLDPAVARAWLPALASALAGIDPGNADLYRANAAAAADRLAALEAAIAARLRPLAGRGFVVFHDAYAHFVARFGLSQRGAISLSDATRPGAARLGELRDAVASGAVICVFSEPQFSPRLAELLVEGTGARLGTLDATGSALAPGPGLYPALLEGLAAGFEACLAP
jgi:zinc transport system substrate-binding protein